jgi:hypothetical protein
VEEAPQPWVASLSDVSLVLHVVLGSFFSSVLGAWRGALKTKKGPGVETPGPFGFVPRRSPVQQARAVRPQARVASFVGVGQQQMHARIDIAEAKLPAVPVVRKSRLHFS